LKYSNSQANINAYYVYITILLIPIG
jgi:hypothetical protein